MNSLPDSVLARPTIAALTHPDTICERALKRHTPDSAQLLSLAFLVMGLDLKQRGESPGLSGCLLTQEVCGALLLILLMSSKF